MQFEGEEFRVTELNILARRVRIQSESGRVLDVGFDSLSRNPATQSWELKAKVEIERVRLRGVPCSFRSVTFLSRQELVQLAEHRRELALGEGELADAVQEDPVEIAVVRRVVHAHGPHVPLFRKNFTLTSGVSAIFFAISPSICRPMRDW